MTIVSNVKALGAFNQEKTLVGTFSMIVKTDCETNGSSAALVIIPAQMRQKIQNMPRCGIIKQCIQILYCISQ